jgi:hypothetical protein
MIELGSSGRQKLVDLSKLPRLSGSEALPPPQAPAIEPQAAPASAPPITPAANYIVGPELFISVIVGLMLVGISRHFPAYLFDQLTGRVYHTGVTFVSDGAEVPYPQLEGFTMLSDAAIFAFGLALLCDACIRLLCLVLGATGRRIAFLVAILLTAAATLFNLVVAGKLLSADVMPLISGLAVAFGGYMAFEQIRAAGSLR